MPRARRIVPPSIQSRDLPSHVRQSLAEPRAIRLVVQPGACAGGVRQRDHDGVGAARVHDVALADALAERRDAEQTPDREPADRHDQLRAQQTQLPLVPEATELLLSRCGHSVATAGGGPAGVAPRHRGAIEALVELVALESEPAAEGLAGAAAPGKPLLAFDEPRSLAEEVRALPVVRGAHRPRFERVAGLDARSADGQVPLQRRDRAVEAPAYGHAAVEPMRTRFPSGSRSSTSRIPYSVSAAVAPKAAATSSTLST